MDIVLSDVLKHKALRGDPFAMGLRSATTKEVEDLLAWLKDNNVKHQHVTHLDNGEKLPFNGVIRVNLNKVGK